MRRYIVVVVVVVEYLRYVHGYIEAHRYITHTSKMNSFLKQRSIVKS